MTTAKGYRDVEEDWVDFLDWALSSTYGTFRKNIRTIDNMGYLDCLGYFIAIALDTQSWSPHELAYQLGQPVQYIKDMKEAYSIEPEYEEPDYFYLSYPSHYGDMIITAKEMVSW